MNSIKKFISIDWGTTNFRLRLVDFSSLSVLEEIENGFGVKEIYQQFLTSENNHQKDFFLSFLESQLFKLNGFTTNTPIIISGMASSNIGLFELEYANLPMTTSGKGITFKKIESKNFDTIVLISGVKSDTDIMRGEETQVLGLLEKIKDGVLLLPGTHSKHLRIENNQVVDFKTFMTGELFELISKKSLLANSIETLDWNVMVKDSFKKGLQEGLSKNITANLFSIRAKHVLGKTSKTENYYFLSGLLIGNEISYVQNTNKTIYLATTSRANKLYKLALQELSSKINIIVFDENYLIRGLLEGQKKILKLYDN